MCSRVFETLTIHYMNEIRTLLMSCPYADSQENQDWYTHTERYKARPKAAGLLFSLLSNLQSLEICGEALQNPHISSMFQNIVGLRVPASPIPGLQARKIYTIPVLSKLHTLTVYSARTLFIDFRVLAAWLHLPSLRSIRLKDVHSVDWTTPERIIKAVLSPYESNITSIHFKRCEPRTPHLDLLLRCFRGLKDFSLEF